ncbi:MAG: SDR family oxidoreductase [Gammaproteobacteria bacterium]|nr:SDR family oxidoreductase [Gammaproteobacteria bacterium]
MENTPFNFVTILGFGDLGRRVAALWRAQGLAVSGLARSDNKQQEMKNQGLVPVQADLDTPLPDLEMNLAAGLVYWFIPPSPTGMVDMRVQHLLEFLDRHQPPQRIVAISTSGVYGDQQGRLVDETTPPNPQADRAHRRLNMETKLNDWGEQHQVPVIILRVGGIYGPGKLPLQRIKDGVPILKEELAPKTNRIHIDDLAQVCVAAATKPQASRIYNVSDGQEANMTEYFLTLADFYNLPRPPQVDWPEAETSISAGMLSYLRESRRLDTRRMQNELAVKLKYPTLVEGLAAIESE